MLHWLWLYERYSLMVFFKNILKIGFWQSFATLILDCGLTLPNYFLTKNLFGQLKTFPHNFDPTIFITIGFVHIVISLVIPFLEQEQNLFGHESFWQKFCSQNFCWTEIFFNRKWFEPNFHQPNNKFNGFWHNWN